MPGMGRLGITNTAHFHDVTKIEDAIRLNNELQHKISKKVFIPQQEMEFEDKEGNIITKEAYNQLYNKR